MHLRTGVDRDDALLALLQQILDKLDAIHAALSAPKTAALSRRDRQQLETLLPAIAGARGSDPFTVADLLEHRAVRLVLGALDARAVGRLLHRATGTSVDGYVVERVGAELNRVVWRIVATP